MVAITDVRASNAAFKASRPPVVAVFVGATSGIGLSTLEKLAAASDATLYVFGRSKASASPLLANLAKINANARVNFIETEISLIKNIDKACEEIAAKEKKIDLLFLSPGGITLNGRVDTSEGIDEGLALRYFSRLRFVQNLLPLLEASASPRVIAILAGGKESEIDLNNLEMKTDFNSIKAASLGATMTTLAFEELAKTHPKITYIHKYPGFVHTGAVSKILNSVGGPLSILARIVDFLILPVINLFAISQEEAGERGLFLATSARYPPSQSDAPGVTQPEGLEIAESSIITDGKRNGVYTLGEADDTAPATPAMLKYREDGSGKIVWEETIKVWDRALERSA